MPDIKYLETLKDAVRTNLPANAFLKLDRGDGLLITNLSPNLLIDGFISTQRGSITVLYPSADIVSAFETLYEPAGELSRCALRFKGVLAEPESIILFSEGLKLSQMSSSAQLDNYDKRVRQYFAQAMRTGFTGGTYAIALLDDMLNNPVEVLL